MRQGPQPGQQFSLAKPTITIGREVGNDVVINDPQVSRRHASLTWDGRQFIIQDLGSMNGTFVNGVRLIAPQVLQQGDVIGLGQAVLLGFQALPVAPTPPPAYAPPPPVVSPARPEPRRRVEPPAHAPRPPARRRGRFLIPLTALLGLCVFLVVAAALGYFFLWPRGATRPLVLINSPRHGEQVEVGQTVTVHSVARDEGKVVRVELWVDGQLQESQASALPGGTSPFPLVTHWQPSSPGTHTLTARAFNTQGGRANASINVEATEEEDRDGDGVADEADACPDEPGTETADGCPDRDRDGIPNAEDACPDDAGLPEGDGCPVSREGDRDGDGLLDEADACPDEAGLLLTGCPDADGDAIPNDLDACPEEPGAPGAPEGDGCPTPGDSDSDGVPDAEDDCPEAWGSAEHAGCPDSDGDDIPDHRDADSDVPGPAGTDGAPDDDGDGIPNDEDACPGVAGPGPSGCPDTGAGDQDGDGIPDDVDLCPEEPGPGPSGCPADDDEPPEGGIPLWPPPGGGPFGDIGGYATVIPVEFEALEFEVDHDYDEVWCYASLAGGDVERYGPFEPLGERQWDIAAHLGGENSRTVAVHDDESLEVHVECWASNIYTWEEESPGGGLPEGGAWGPVWDLGSFIEYHPRDPDWGGHVITVGSSGGHQGHSFRAQYRICADSCEEAAFAPPVLTLWRGIGNRLRLQWRWGGDESMINGFRLYVNGNFYRAFRPDQRSWEIPSDLEPSCGERLEFQMTAFEGPTPVPNRESPRSNIRFLEGLPCPLPDLTPADVTVHDGQLRIHVLNNGGPLRNEEITVRFETLVSRAEIDTVTWPAVTISPGGIRFLQTGDYFQIRTYEGVEHRPVREFLPAGMRIILDPDNEIEELNEDNNELVVPRRVPVVVISLRGSSAGSAKIHDIVKERARECGLTLTEGENWKKDKGGGWTSDGDAEDIKEKIDDLVSKNGGDRSDLSLLIVGKSAGGVLAWNTFRRHYDEIADFHRAAFVMIDPHGSVLDDGQAGTYCDRQELWWPDHWSSDTDFLRVYNIYQHEKRLTGANFPDPRVYRNIQLKGDGIDHGNIPDNARTHELIREAISFAWLGGVEYIGPP